MSDGKRVVIVGPAPPHRGGIAQHTSQLAAVLGRSGNEVDVESWAAQYPSLLYRRAEQDPDAEGLPGARHELRWFDPLSWVRAARRHRGADVLILQWVTPFNFAAVAVLRFLMKPALTVAVVHNARPHEWFPMVGPLSRLALRNIDRTVCHASAIVDELESLGIRVGENVVVGLPPIVPVFPSSLPDRPPIKLLFLGYLRRYKGADIAVSSISVLKTLHPELAIELTVAGEAWSSEDAVDTLVASEGLEKEVTVLDRYLSDEEMAQLISEHHLLVAPYRSATQSGVVSLAIGGARAVVATDVGGLAEVVHDGVNGTVSVPDDVEAFSAAIMRAVEDLDALTRGAAEQAVTWDEVAAHLTRSA